MEEGKRVRSVLEATVDFYTAKGRGIIFPVTSYLDFHVKTNKVGPESFILSSAKRGTDFPSENFPAVNFNRITHRNFYLVYRKTVSFIQIIQSILFENTPAEVSNVALAHSDKIFDYKEVESRVVTLDAHPFMETRQKKLYLAKKDSFNFVTCYGLHNKASLSVYLVPFDNLTWITLFSILFLTSCILTAISCLSAVRTPLEQILSFWFYGVSMILENNDGGKNPVYTSRITYTPRIIFTILSYICIVIGCLYKAVITRDIISPLPDTILYERISQLKNFELLVLPSYITQKENGTLMARLIEDRNNKSEKTEYDHILMTSLSVFGEELSAIGRFDSDTKYDAQSLISQLLIFPFKEDVYEYLEDCNQKRALVGLSIELENFIKSPIVQQSFGYGKDQFLPFNYYWQIPYAAGGYLHRRMSSIISSGIDQVWEKINWRKTRNELDESLRRTVEREQGLNTNLAALFKIVLIGEAIALFVFLMEMLIKTTRLFPYSALIRLLSNEIRRHIPN